MTSASIAALPRTTPDEDAWDDLLSFIEERRVVPIVGPELLMVTTERGPRLLFDWVAEKLAARLNVRTTDLPQPYTLNDVVCLFLAGRGRREKAYVRLRSLVKDANFEPPPAPRHLAAISDFDLFVATTADSLLENAINLERFAGASSTEVLSYSPNRVFDLPFERERLQCPVVKLQRDLASKNHGDRWLPLELAGALYVESLTDSKNGATSLREAVELVQGLPPDLRSVRDAEEWRERILQGHVPRPGSTCAAIQQPSRLREFGGSSRRCRRPGAAAWRRRDRAHAERAGASDGAVTT